MTLDQLITLFILGGAALAVLALVYWFRQQQRRQKNQLLLQRLEELETLNRVSRSIGKTKLDPAALANLIAEEASEIIDTANFQVGLFEGSTLTVLYASDAGRVVETPIRIILENDAGIIANMRTRMETVHIADVAKLATPIVIEGADLVSIRPRSVLLIPLISGEKTIGMIGTLSEEPAQYDASRISRLEIVANQAASALSAAELYEEELRLSSDLELVSSIARQVNSLEDPAAIFEQVGDFAHQQLRLHLVMINSYDSSTQHAELQYSSHPDFMPGEKVESFGDGLIGTALRERCTLVVNDVSSDPRYIPGLGLPGYEYIAERTTSEVVIPLIAKNDLIGVMDFQNDHANGFSDREVRVLEALAQEVAGALDRARELTAQREQAWVTQAQLEVARTIAQYANLDEMLEAMMRLVQMLLGIRRCAVLLKDETGETFRPKAIIGVTPSTANHFMRQTLKSGDWGALDACNVGQAQRSVDKTPSWFPTRESDVVTLYPLVAGGVVHGVMLTQANQSELLSGKHHALLDELRTSVLRQLSRRIERSQLRAAQQAEAWNNVALLQIAQTMNSTYNLKKILDSVVRLVPMLTGVAFSFLLVSDDDGETLTPSASYGLNGEALLALTHTDPASLSRMLNLRAQPVATEQQSLLDIKLTKKLAFVFEKDHIQAIPLRARNTLVGVLALGSTIDGAPIRGRRYALVAGIAQQAALAVVNDQLTAESSETERLQQEINVALSIQSSLIPDGSPNIPGLAVASHWEAAREVSGDFYDFLPLADGKWAIVIADVAGKGVPAALFMALTRTIIRSVSFSHSDAAGTLIRANDIILNDTHSDLFVTVFYAIWDPATGSLAYANGGHNRPFLLANDGTVSELGEYGMALGIIESMPLEVQHAQLEVGDSVVFYTDGITEAMNADGDTLGHRAVVEWLESEKPQTPQSTIRGILRRTEVHSSGIRQSDDMTMVVVRRVA